MSSILGDMADLGEKLAEHKRLDSPTGHAGTDTLIGILSAGNVPFSIVGGPAWAQPEAMAARKVAANKATRERADAMRTVRVSVRELGFKTEPELIAHMTALVSAISDDGMFCDARKALKGVLDDMWEAQTGEDE